MTKQLAERLAHTFLLMAIDALVELDPEANSPLGRMLDGVSAAVETYEITRFPLHRSKRKSQKPRKRRLAQ